MVLRAVGMFSLCCVLGLAVGCRKIEPQARAETGSQTRPFFVVATTGMVGDIVRHVAGDQARVVNLIGEGVDPHLYKATTTDMAQLADAEIVFLSGLLLEGKMTGTLEKVRRRKPVIAVTERLPASYLLEHVVGEGHPDPHVWMDVGAWASATDVVVDALTEFDPAGAETYRVNGQAYAKRLHALDDYVRGVIGSIPKEQRVLITAHDAFGYFGRAYGIEVRGIQGISTESEAGAYDILELVDYIVEHRIGAVFVETSVADKSVKSLIEGARSRGHDLKIGGSLFSDAMGAPGTYCGTYAGMLDHNATLIARALGGVAPAAGMNGELN